MRAICIKEHHHNKPLKLGDVVEYERTDDGGVHVPILNSYFQSSYFHKLFRPEGVENMYRNEFDDELYRAYYAKSIYEIRHMHTVKFMVYHSIIHGDKPIICSIDERTHTIRVSFDHGPWELFTNYGEAFMAICGHEW